MRTDLDFSPAATVVDVPWARPAPRIDLHDPGLPRALPGAFDALRAADPVHPLRDGMWLLTRHDDVTAILADGERCGTGTRPPAGGTALERFQEGLLRSLGAADHRRVRAWVARPLTRAQVGRSTSALVAGLAAEHVAALPDRGEVDWVATVARPLPARVFAALFALPDRDADLLLRLAHAHAVALDALLAPDLVAPDDLVRGRRAVLELRDYVESLAVHRHRHRRDDLLSVLLDGHDAGWLTWDDVLTQAVEALAAGTSTTMALLAGMADALAAHPAQWSRVRADPGLMRPAVEETARHVSPASVMGRVALRDFRLRGRAIRAGDVLQCAVVAANHDPAAFARPHAFDAARTPNAHVAFGGSAHTCLAAHVARLAARTVLGRAVRRWRRIDVEPDAVELHPMLLVRSYRTLPVRLA